ncbi:hairy and enhancer of split-related protein HELT isoform X1 [Piliocolobus tephrosceles]|uniref:hairy and enhancer of split-related protein HELT isoform X1 n=1 Tax=Piliocolobus tephrosceles TaxID=591936 RepID=UPI000C2A85EB|nr:hairy and enhancer of split-related protein HELT isoform X1 [Piliocolobus tephrosceles]
MSDKLKERKRTPVSHKVIEKRRRDRINRCLNELGKTVPMALAKQVTLAARSRVPGFGRPLRPLCGDARACRHRGPHLRAPLREPERRRASGGSGADPQRRPLAGPLQSHSARSASAGPLRGALFLLLQSSGKLEKAEILEMTVQYLRALHSADFPRGREKELLAEFANYFHYGYHECMKNLVHYLTTVERMETKDTKYARILAFLQSKARLGAEPAFPPLGSLPEPDFSYQLHPAGPEFAGHSPGEAAVFPQGSGAGPFPWPPGAARSPALPYLPSASVPLASPAQQHSPFLTPVQGLDRHYLNLIGHAHPNALNLHTPQHPPVL